MEVNAIVKLDDLIVLLEEDEQHQQHLASIQKYREQYGS